MKIKLLNGGIMPTRAHFDDAGIDFYTPEDVTVPANGGSAVIDLKVAMQIPVGYFGKLESKSGLNVNHSVVSLGGVIDSGFRGSVMAKLYNFSTAPYHFHRGDKVVQMVIQPCGLFDLEEVKDLDLSESGRDESGWGSTGR